MGRTEQEILAMALNATPAPAGARGQQKLREENDATPLKRKPKRQYVAAPKAPKAPKVPPAPKKPKAPKAPTAPDASSKASAAPKAAPKARPKAAATAAATKASATAPSKKESSGLVMTAKCVHSRAYHRALLAARKQGIPDDAAKALARDAGAKAREEFALDGA